MKGAEPRVRSFLAVWLALGALIAMLAYRDWYWPDVWTYLSLGRSVVESGNVEPKPLRLISDPGFVNVYWLFEVLCFSFFKKAGPEALTVVFAGLWLAIFGLWTKLVGSDRPSPWLPVLALTAVLASHLRFEIRAEVFSYLFLCIQLYLLESGGVTRPGALAPKALFLAVQIFWANSHGFFFLGPAILGLKLLIQPIVTPERHWRERLPVWSRLGGLMLLSLGATLVTPLGLGGWRFVLSYFGYQSEMSVAIVELMPPTGLILERLWTLGFWWAFALATLGAIVWLVRFRPREAAFSICLALIGLWLGSHAIRHAALAVLLAGPLWRCALTGPSALHAAGARFSDQIVSGVGISAVLLALWTVNGGFYRSLELPARFGVRVSELLLPVRILDYLERRGFTGSVFNEPYSGGYLSFHRPSLRVYGDGRFTTERKSSLEYIAALNDPEKFLELDRIHKFDAVVLRPEDSTRIVAALIARPDWIPASADLGYVLILNTERNPALKEAVEPPRFYQGEDLSLRPYGNAAIQWIHALSLSNNRPALLEALRQFGHAPQVPSPIVLYCLKAGRALQDRELVRAGLALALRVVTTSEAEASEIGSLVGDPVLRDLAG